MTYVERFNQNLGIRYYSYARNRKSNDERRLSYFHTGNRKTFKKDWRTSQRTKYNYYSPTGNSLRFTAKQTLKEGQTTSTESALYRRALQRREAYKAFSKLYE